MAPFEQYRDAAGKKRWRTVTKINDWILNPVAIKSVPANYRATYRATLLAAARAARDCGVKLHANSSFRFYTEQKRLYEAYLKGGTLAAKPGTSMHEHGRALDLSVASGKHMGVSVGNVVSVRNALVNRGLIFAVPSEAWHVEYHKGN